MDVMEAECLGVTGHGVGAQIFGGVHEPLERNDDKVTDGAVCMPVLEVHKVKDMGEMAENGDIGWVRMGGRTVFLAEGGQESNK